MILLVAFKPIKQTAVVYGADFWSLFLHLIPFTIETTLIEVILFNRRTRYVFFTKSNALTFASDKLRVSILAKGVVYLSPLPLSEYGFSLREQLPSMLV